MVPLSFGVESRISLNWRLSDFNDNIYIFTLLLGKSCFFVHSFFFDVFFIIFSLCIILQSCFILIALFSVIAPQPMRCRRESSLLINYVGCNVPVVYHAVGSKSGQCNGLLLSSLLPNAARLGEKHSTFISPHSRPLQGNAKVAW